ncbi:hypothetical protein [Pectinatus frisingensis]|uniref:hypothetical protein n=1 Tax=Pectinatus frisingensis TaxID=865 RepID=UPI0018C73329|nr:hypothetical protein [Pectinatus frisingensis]
MKDSKLLNVVQEVLGVLIKNNLSVQDSLRTLDVVNENLLRITIIPDDAKIKDIRPNALSQDVCLTNPMPSY